MNPSMRAAVAWAVSLLLGVSAFSGIITLAFPWCGGYGTPNPVCHDWWPWAAAAAVVPAGFLAGAVFVITVGTIANFVLWSGIVGFVLALVFGEWMRAPAFLLIAVAGWWVAWGQNGRTARVYPLSLGRVPLWWCPYRRPIL